MGVCCTTAFLVGAICGCWPCFLPCCIFLPLIPYPIVVVRVPKRKEEDCDSDDESNKSKDEKLEDKCDKQKCKETCKGKVSSREGSNSSQKRDSQVTNDTDLERRESKCEKEEIKEENNGDACFKDGSKCNKIEKSSPCQGKGSCKEKKTSETNNNRQKRNSQE